MAHTSIIDIKGLCKAFGTKVVSNGLDLKVREGEFLAIIGRSGEGKSVLLKQKKLATKYFRSADTFFNLQRSLIRLPFLKM
jgi:ABC-type transporter Mla maintaining outer membrane lipid asymmetry ATPase subunit MlaF